MYLKHHVTCLLFCITLISFARSHDAVPQFVSIGECCERNTSDRSWCDVDSCKLHSLSPPFFKLTRSQTNTGTHIQAHGGGILKVGSKYYWVGEDKTNGTAFTNVNCYSSTNLVEWNYEGALLSRTVSGDTGPNRVIERPKVMFNEKTNKYVLWMHIDSSDYKEAKIGVATGDSVCGKYTYLRSEKPLGFESRDSGVYVDDDGKGYLLTEDVRTHLPVKAHAY
jgi:hypothetical protein